jgi:capsular polysaccharide biosynthesis protein
MGEIDKNMRFLNQELQAAQVVELRTAIAQVMQAQVSERMLASVRQEYALKIIDPALPSDADRPVRPRKVLYCALGLSAGSFLGFAFGLILFYWRTRIAR